MTTINITKDGRTVRKEFASRNSMIQFLKTEILKLKIKAEAGKVSRDKAGKTIKNYENLLDGLTAKAVRSAETVRPATSRFGKSAGTKAR